MLLTRPCCTSLGTGSTGGLVSNVGGAVSIGSFEVVVPSVASVSSWVVGASVTVVLVAVDLVLVLGEKFLNMLKRVVLVGASVSAASCELISVLVSAILNVAFSKPVPLNAGFKVVILIGDRSSMSVAFLSSNIDWPSDVSPCSFRAVWNAFWVSSMIRLLNSSVSMSVRERLQN